MDGKIATIAGLIMAVVIAGILIGNVLPVGMNAINEDRTDTHDMAESETIEVATNLNATLDDVEDSSGDINLTLKDTTTGSTYTVTDLAVGSNETKSIGDLGDVTVYNEEQIDNGNSTVMFEFSNDFGWSESTQSVYSILGIFLIVAILTALAGWAVKAFRT